MEPLIGFMPRSSRQEARKCDEIELPHLLSFPQDSRRESPSIINLMKFPLFFQLNPILLRRFFTISPILSFSIPGR